ncbi:MAG TPA: dicarboxylate/amino acid:cation symporter [Myxococcota bacterium]|nr:dicarboxylate/amino acid:cation symporter [Myxococcota bacterium]
MHSGNRAAPGLTAKIAIGMAAGLAVGCALNAIGVGGWLERAVVDGVFRVGGAIFLASLKLLVVPLVFVSLVCGTAALDDIAKLGRVGAKTLGLYLGTTVVAIALALLAGALVEPGAGFALDTGASYQAQPAPSPTEVIIGLFPSNPIRAMADENMLQIIVFAGLFGLALTLAGEPGKRLAKLFEDFNAVILRLVLLLMQLAPYGVFCLIAKVFAVQGFAAMQPLLKYFLLVLFVLAVHATVTYPLLLRLGARLNPLAFYRSMRDPIALAFSTASSNATLPVTLETVEHKLGVSRSIASFTIPLGATINMDGTAIMQGVATAFIAQAYGIELSLADYATVVATATLASIGTAGVPGVGLVMLAMVLRQVNLPVEGIGLVLGVDRLLDMARTAVNITGDASVSCVVAASERQLSREIFERDTRRR